MVAYALDSRRGDPIVTITAGHSPRNPDELVMGRTTMRRHNLHIGDDVALTIAGQAETFRVVGQAVFPIGDNAFDDSLALTNGGARRFTGLADESGTNQILLTWNPGVDEARGRRELEASGYRVLDRPRLPPSVTNLIQVDQVPGLLTVFFASLGVSAFGYLVGAWSRARGRQFAVLATLGLRPREIAAIRRWQAFIVTLIAALIGVPIGIVTGRLVWAAIANNAGVAVSHVAPVRTIVGVAVMSIAAALAIAAALSQKLHRLSLAVALRAG